MEAYRSDEHADNLIGLSTSMSEWKRVMRVRALSERVTH